MIWVLIRDVVAVKGSECLINQRQDVCINGARLWVFLNVWRAGEEKKNAVFFFMCAPFMYQHSIWQIGKRGVGCKDPVHQKKKKGFQTLEHQGLRELSALDRHLQCVMDARPIVLVITLLYEVLMSRTEHEWINLQPLSIFIFTKT